MNDSVASVTSTISPVTGYANDPMLQVLLPPVLQTTATAESANIQHDTMSQDILRVRKKRHLYFDNIFINHTIILK